MSSASPTARSPDLPASREFLIARPEMTPGSARLRRGLRSAAFTFSARAASRRHDPVWFKPRKAVYGVRVLARSRALVAAVGDGARRGGGDTARRRSAAQHLFRIYRDVRFAPAQAALQDPCRRGPDALGGSATRGATPICIWNRESRWIRAGFLASRADLRLTRLRRASSHLRRSRPAFVRNRRHADGGRQSGLQR